MSEIKSSEINEMRNPELDNYKNIQPESTTLSEACSFFKSLFTGENVELDKDEFGARYNSEETCRSHTPTDGERGHYVGERGVSKYIPSDTTENGKVCIEKLAEYNQDGIEYKNFEPDFSEVSESTVKIDNMTEERDNYYDDHGDLQEGNFSQADQKCAELWNQNERDNRIDWTAEDVYQWRHDPAHQCTWHERCDTKTMDLVPYEIHSYFGHLGGVSECRVRDSQDNGGDFDE